MMLMMGFMFIVPFLLIGGVAYALSWRPGSDQSAPASKGQTPMEILKARYAGGTISREQYDEMHRELER